MPQDNLKLPLSKYETGKLKFGNGNPKSKDYNSLSDFYVQGDNVEIKIPWQLLNIMDPSSKKIMDDFHLNTIVQTDVNEIYVGGTLIKNNTMLNSDMYSYSWEKWDKPTYHERLKPSYYILKNTFKNIGGN